MFGAPNNAAKQKVAMTAPVVSSKVRTFAEPVRGRVGGGWGGAKCGSLRREHVYFAIEYSRELG